MTQNFHDEPVQQLKFNPSSPNSTQEFCVLYSKVVITIEVLGLFNSLRALRSCLAKGVFPYPFSNPYLLIICRRIRLLNALKTVDNEISICFDVLSSASDFHQVSELVTLVDFI